MWRSWVLIFHDKVCAFLRGWASDSARLSASSPNSDPSKDRYTQALPQPQPHLESHPILVGSRKSLRVWDQHCLPFPLCFWIPELELLSWPCEPWNSFSFPQWDPCIYCLIYFILTILDGPTEVEQKSQGHKARQCLSGSLDLGQAEPMLPF